MSAVPEQVVAQDCPICMDTIEGLYNRVVTECGHAFHCSCLMQNTAHNGFGCPYCRTAMAAEVEEAEDDDYSVDDESMFPEDALVSFRMFHQQINGEEVEEEEPEEWETDDEDEDEDEADGEENRLQMPDVAYMAQKLANRGITFEDLVKNVLYQEHSNFGEHYADYGRRSSEVYGQFRAIIFQYSHQEPVPVPVHAPVPVPVISQVESIGLPDIAESKSVGTYRRREFMYHS